MTHPFCRYFDWLTLGLPMAEARLERSQIYGAANCFLQAAEDGAAGVRAVLASGGAGPALARAYRCLGAGLLAAPKHPDRRPKEAAVALLKALDQDPDCEESKRLLEEAVQELTKEAYDEV